MFLLTDGGRGGGEVEFNNAELLDFCAWCSAKPNFEITFELPPISPLCEGRIREGMLCGFFVI